jgi:endonuclease/exonuclease/phosphatase family metal-dependent hydrolase
MTYNEYWKSKSGGKEETELWRNYQQSLLQNVVKNHSYNFVVCGDFNRDLKDFNIENEFLILNDDMNFPSNSYLYIEENQIKLKSSWIDFSTEEEGSYFYQNEWEKIDHFFVSKDCVIKEFYTIKNGPNITEEGIPFRYNLWNGLGYSDHLPIVCTVIF